MRIDTGVEAGAEITPWYDPMIAKLIVRGVGPRPRRSRGCARRSPRWRSPGPTTNVAFLRRVAASRAFAAAELDTGLIERNRAELFPEDEISDEAARGGGLRRARRGGARRARARRRRRATRIRPGTASTAGA